MLLKVPLPTHKIIVTEVLQGSDVCFDWNAAHNTLTKFIREHLSCVWPISKRRFLEKQESCRAYCNQHWKSLASPFSKHANSKKTDTKVHASAEKAAGFQRKNKKRRNPKDTDRATRLTLVCVVSILLAIAVVVHMFIKDDMILGITSSAFNLVLGYYFGKSK